ncbi:MAG: hypothetical protein GTO40_05525, partial [Deltaproteobacteria bacterium]|nr:hypothetical protein [Deltaproteobacteria bacterium]
MSGGFQADHFPQVWDLTACDMVISFTYDANGLVDDAGAHAWAELGVRTFESNDFNPSSQGVWLASDYEWVANTFDPDPVGSPIQDLDDKLILQKVGGIGEIGYDLLWDYSTGTPSLYDTPPNTGANHAVWFDRDGVSPSQEGLWGAIDGVTYNTGGTYEVVISLHATGLTAGEAYMTINGEPQGFYDPGWHSGPADLMPAGMTFTGDMTQMQVFYGLSGYNATHSVTFMDIEVTGCMVLDEEGMVTGGGWFESPSGAHRLYFFNGFETNTSDWFDYGGSITRVASGTNGVTSADGDWHAEIEIGPANGDGVFTRFGGYSSIFPAGGFSQLVDVYIDPAMGNIGEGWALDNALNGDDGVWKEAGG